MNAKKTIKWITLVGTVITMVGTVIVIVQAVKLDALFYGKLALGLVCGLASLLAIVHWWPVLQPRFMGAVQTIWRAIRKVPRKVAGRMVLVGSVLIAVWIWSIDSTGGWGAFDEAVRQANTDRRSVLRDSLRAAVIRIGADTTREWTANAALRHGLLNYELGRLDSTGVKEVVTLARRISPEISIPDWLNDGLVRASAQRLAETEPPDQLDQNHGGIIVFYGDGSSGLELVQDLSEYFGQVGLPVVGVNLSLPWSEDGSFYADVVAIVSRCDFAISAEAGQTTLFSVNRERRRWMLAPLPKVEKEGEQETLADFGRYIEHERAINQALQALTEGRMTEALGELEDLAETEGIHAGSGLHVSALRALVHYLLGEVEQAAALHDRVGIYSNAADFKFIESLFRIARFASSDRAAEIDDIDGLLQSRRSQLSREQYEFLRICADLAGVFRAESGEGDESYNSMSPPRGREGISVNFMEIVGEKEGDPPASEQDHLLGIAARAEQKRRYDIASIARSRALYGMSDTSQVRSALEGVLAAVDTAPYIAPVAYLMIFPQMLMEHPQLFQGSSWERLLGTVVERSEAILNMEIEREVTERVLTRSFALIPLYQAAGIEARSRLTESVKNLAAGNFSGLARLGGQLFSLYATDRVLFKKELRRLLRWADSHASQSAHTPEERLNAAWIQEILAIEDLVDGDYAAALEHVELGLAHMRQAAPHPLGQYLQTVFTSEAWILTELLHDRERAQAYYKLALGDLEASLSAVLNMQSESQADSLEVRALVGSMVEPIQGLGQILVDHELGRINVLNASRKALVELESLNVEIDDLEPLSAKIMAVADLIVHDIVAVVGAVNGTVGEQDPIWRKIAKKSTHLTAPQVYGASDSSSVVVLLALLDAVHQDLWTLSHLEEMDDHDSAFQIMKVVSPALDKMDRLFAGEGDEVLYGMMLPGAGGHKALGAALLLQFRQLVGIFNEAGQDSLSVDRLVDPLVQLIDKQLVNYLDQLPHTPAPAYTVRIEKGMILHAAEHYENAIQTFVQLKDQAREKDDEMIAQLADILTTRAYYATEDYRNCFAAIQRIYDANPGMRKYLEPMRALGHVAAGNLDSASVLLDRYFDEVLPEVGPVHQQWDYLVEVKIGEKGVYNLLLVQPIDFLAIMGTFEFRIGASGKGLAAEFVALGSQKPEVGYDVPFYYALYRVAVELARHDLPKANAALEKLVDLHTSIGEYISKPYQDHLIWVACHADLVGLGFLAQRVMGIAKEKLAHKEHQSVTAYLREERAGEEDEWIPRGFKLIPDARALAPLVARQALVTAGEDLYRLSDLEVIDDAAYRQVIPRSDLVAHAMRHLRFRSQWEPTVSMGRALEEVGARLDTNTAQGRALASGTRTAGRFSGDEPGAKEEIAELAFALFEEGYTYEAVKLAQELAPAAYQRFLLKLPRAARTVQTPALHERYLARALVERDFEAATDLVELTSGYGTDSALSGDMVTMWYLLIALSVEQGAPDRAADLMDSLMVRVGRLDDLRVMRQAVALVDPRSTPKGADTSDNLADVDVSALASYLVEFYDDFHESTRDDRTEIQEVAARALDRHAAHVLGWIQLALGKKDIPAEDQLALLQSSYDWLRRSTMESGLRENILSFLAMHYFELGKLDELKALFTEMEGGGLDPVAATWLADNIDSIAHRCILAGSADLGWHLLGLLEREEIRYSQAQAVRRDFARVMLEYSRDQDWDKTIEEMIELLEALPRTSKRGSMEDQLRERIVDQLNSISVPEEKLETVIQLTDEVVKLLGESELAYKFELGKAQLYLADADWPMAQRTLEGVRAKAEERNDETTLKQIYSMRIMALLEGGNIWNEGGTIDPGLIPAGLDSLEGFIGQSLNKGFWDTACYLIETKLYLLDAGNRSRTERDRAIGDMDQIAARHDLQEWETASFYWRLRNERDSEQLISCLYDYLEWVGAQPAFAEVGQNQRIIEYLLGTTKDMDWSTMDLTESLGDLQAGTPQLLNTGFTFSLAALLGNAYVNQGLLEEANDQFALAQHLGRKGGGDPAEVRELEIVISHNYMAIGVNYAGRDSLARARPYLERAVQWSPDNLQAVDFAAKAAYGSGDHREALAFLQLGIERQPSNAWWRHFSASIYLQGLQDYPLAYEEAKVAYELEQTSQYATFLMEAAFSAGQHAHVRTMLDSMEEEEFDLDSGDRATREMLRAFYALQEDEVDFAPVLTFVQTWVEHREELRGNLVFSGLKAYVENEDAFVWQTKNRMLELVGLLDGEVQVDGVAEALSSYPAEVLNAIKSFRVSQSAQ